MRFFQTKFIKKIKHILCSVSFFFSKRCFYEKMWKNTVESGREQMTIWRMRNACWIPMATNKHTQVVSYSLPFHCSNFCTNAPYCYVIITFTVLLLFQPTNPQTYITAVSLYILYTSTDTVVKYRVIRNDFWGFNNLSYTINLR